MNHHILVVEDSPTQAMQLRLLLEEHDYEVTVAVDGKEGLAAARTHRPTLIISDIVMPVMDGYEMCWAIKQDEALMDIPVIVLTSLSDLEDVIRGLKAEADYYLTKPCDDDILLRTVEFALAAPVRQRSEEQASELAITYAGQLYVITSDRQQILKLLFSTYESAIRQNQELVKVQLELQRFNEQLEEKVRERTATLRAEITERKRAEEKLRESEERFRGLYENAPAAYLSVGADGLIHRCNRRAGELLGCAAKELVGRPVFELYADTPQGKEKASKVFQRFRAGGTITDEDLQMQRADGTLVWVSLTVNVVRDESGRVVESRSVIVDITERKRAEEELQQSFVKLQRTLAGTVNVLVSTIEMRDPYTAGHQRRVTQLAYAIAKEMDLSEERIEGLRMAGLVHDIGKISIPAEILSKPVQLNDLEWGMIKTHPQVGYDILKEVDFSWPVAQIVLQHHERIDGSSYPAELSGDEIMLEARILAVADVVEAMASFRPYRPARGLDKALEEISQNRGILYDPEVVDVCLNLFSEKGFEFGGRDE